MVELSGSLQTAAALGMRLGCAEASSLSSPMCDTSIGHQETDHETA
jgi:hypothetical protein